MKIKLFEAHAYLSECVAVITQEQDICHPHVENLKGEEDNEFLFIAWIGMGGDVYNTKFTEGENSEVEIADGHTLILTDYEGDEFMLTLLKPWDILEKSLTYS